MACCPKLIFQLFICTKISSISAGIIGRWNKLDNTNVLQDNTVDNMLYITEIIH